MKKISTLFFMLLPLLINAQITFEQGVPGTGTWTAFANGTGDGFVTIVANPAKSDINKSDSVIMYNVSADGDPWSGFFTDSIEPIEITNDNAIFTVAVYKDVITDFDFKLEKADSGDPYELKVPNTKTNEWEILQFDFSSKVGVTFSRLTIIPDFPSVRSEGSICYIDNISSIKALNDKASSVAKAGIKSISVFPNPSSNYFILKNVNAGTRISITDILGKQYGSQVLKNKFDKVPVANLKAGVYFVSGKTEKGSFILKFVKR